MSKNIDILSELDFSEELDKKNSIELHRKHIKNLVINIFEKRLSPLKILLNKLYTLFKFVLTSAFIFLVLLITTNYSAYTSIAMSYINKDKIVEKQNLLVTSVQASSEIEEKKIVVEERTVKEFNEDEIKYFEKDIHSINKIIKNSNEDLNLDIEITPYENRVVIPKIGKNIPLIEIENQQISTEKALNDLFMKELEKWIIRYPGSAKPGNIWNSFIFWHSSNFPWIQWEYNEVFASLYKLEFWDEIIIYYNQEKYIYKIRTKNVISPKDVSMFKKKKQSSEVTLMTCWPIWTTLNRLIVTWELVKE